MGLNAYVEGSRTGVRLGSYGWYHSFRSTVCSALEGGQWGSRFPYLQNHSDCEGEYTPAEAAELLKEVLQIESELAAVSYPAALYLDDDGKVLVEEYKYRGEGTFCYASGFSFGVDERGLVVESYDTCPDPRAFGERRRSVLGEIVFVAHFDCMERVDGAVWRCFAADYAVDLEVGPALCAPEGCVRIVRGTRSAAEIFRQLIDNLKALCNASVETGNPIVFC
ncbi:MAG: Imm70 family immunity protein [Moorellales bacterium]